MLPIKIITEIIDIENQFIKLEGWILDSESNTLDSIYLMIDSKPFLKYDDLYEVDIQNRSDMLINEETATGWTITFLAGYIDEGCHTISILGKSDNSLFELDQDLLVCKK